MYSIFYIKYVTTYIRKEPIMNRMQKIAWWLVACISIAMIISLIAVAIAYSKVGMPKALIGFSFLGIAGIGGLAPLVFPKDKGKVTCDERDIQINRRAALAGFGASYLVTGLACMLPFTILGYQASISVCWLPNIFMAAGLTSFFVHSVAILVQYGFKEKNHE
jgi:Na+/proline symporter